MYIDKNDIKQTSKVLGDGSFSRVFLAKYNKKKYALKVLDDISIYKRNNKYLIDMLDDIKILK